MIRVKGKLRTQIAQILLTDGYMGHREMVVIGYIRYLLDEKWGNYPTKDEIYRQLYYMKRDGQVVEPEPMWYRLTNETKHEMIGR
ncbi:MAG: hypothetical protein GY832_30900 [Chloroflexi bacterium]|nr:hypothetical protein [Chloroflexota bacterium]